MQSAYEDRVAAVLNPRIQLPSTNSCGHVVLFYREKGFLLDEICQIIGSALCSGDPAIMIGTQEHRDDLADRLYRQGVDVGEVIQSGSYIEVDAIEVLSEFLVNDAPDPARFKARIGSLVARIMQTAKHDRPVTICDEMAALLWQAGKENAALHLEELWNVLADAYPISLCCSYSLDSFSRTEDGKPFRGICLEHTAVVPGEDYSRLSTTDARSRNVACLQQRSLALETEARLRRSEGRFRKMADAMHRYAIFMLDIRGYFTTWNAGAKRILGYEEPEVLGHHFSCIFTEEDVLARRPIRELQVASSEGRYEGEGWRLRKDGCKFFADVALTPLRGDPGTVIGYAAILQDITERILGQNAREDVRDSILESEKSLRQFSLLVMRRQEEERRRVGGDLLDCLGQYLSVLMMRLDSLRPFAGGRESQVDDELTQCVNLVEESVKEVRAVSYLLYPPLLDEVGLKSAIPWYLEGFTKRSGIKTTFQISPDLRRLSSDANETIFRVLQEALTNVHRHSGSGTADIQLLTKNDYIVLIISDHGKGMPPEILSPARSGISPLGMGLRGMSERMRYLGGRLEISSSGKGATITATIPVASCAAAAMSA
jgi:PAS domain S-box-containing protein